MALLKKDSHLIRIDGKLMKTPSETPSEEVPDITEVNGILTINHSNVQEVPNDKGTTLII